MRNVYVISMLAGILSVPLFFVLAIVIAITQFGSNGTSDTFNTTTFAFLIAIVAGLGFWFVSKVAKGTVSFSSVPELIFQQILVGLIFFTVLKVISNVVFEILPQAMMLNPNRSESTTKQAIEWSTVLITLLFQQIIFWRIVVVRSSNKN